MAHGEEVLAVERRLSLDVRTGGQAEERLGGHALARLGLADDAEGAAPVYIEGHAADGLDDAVGGVERDLEATDLEQAHLLFPFQGDGPAGLPPSFWRSLRSRGAWALSPRLPPSP